MFLRRQRHKIKNPQKFQNEFKSFKKKLGKYSIWFNSLESHLQWDLLFMWKSFKYHHSQKNISDSDPSLRNFLFQTRQKHKKFYVSKQKLREIALNELIK
jgi:hypothetical protein